MASYRFTPEATRDLLDIWDFIAQDNIQAAEQVEAAVFRACEFLVDSPLAGRIRKDLTLLPLRFWPVQPYTNYLIVYDQAQKPLQIIRILHGARDIPSLLA
jgi:antitoxin ParD1/3/4